jgi:hypothetical protein
MNVIDASIRVYGSTSVFPYRMYHMMVAAVARPSRTRRNDRPMWMRSLLLFICVKLLARFCSSTSDVTLLWSFLLMFANESR